MAVARERGLVRDRSQLPDLLLIDQADLRHQCTTVFPGTVSLHLPFGIVGESEGFPTNSFEGGGVDTAHVPQLLFGKSFELVDGALEEHLRRATTETRTVAVVYGESPNSDFVDGVHPFGGAPRTIEDAVGHPETGLGIGSFLRIVALTDESDLVAFRRKIVCVPTLIAFPIGSHGQVTGSLADMAHDATVVAVDGEHEALSILDIRDRADDEVSNLHKSSIQSPDNLVKVVSLFPHLDY